MKSELGSSSECPSQPRHLAGTSPSLTDAARILVVDDDVRLRQVIQTMLEEEGLVVEVAGDGLEAVRRASARRPSLIILDMGLPGLNGQGVASALRAAYGAEVAPILTITADGRAAEDARRVGAYAFLSKPFQFEDLLAAVHQGLELSQ